MHSESLRWREHAVGWILGWADSSLAGAGPGWVVQARRRWAGRTAPARQDLCSLRCLQAGPAALHQPASPARQPAVHHHHSNLHHHHSYPSCPPPHSPLFPDSVKMASIARQIARRGYATASAVKVCFRCSLLVARPVYFRRRLVLAPPPMDKIANRESRARGGRRVESWGQC